jgi:hypothetical protein
MEERRRWGRVKVPDEKITCRVLESQHNLGVSDFVVDNINSGGLAFYSDTLFDANEMMRLLVKFPFTSSEDEGSVWGRVSYSLKSQDKEKFITGVAFSRKRQTQ